jgi:uncharacterized membrane protein YqhA
MINRLLSSSRFLVLITVIVSAISAALLYVVSVYVLFNIVVDTVMQVPATADGGKRLVVRLLKLLDILLIAVTFQIIAVGLYRLFISPVDEQSGSLVNVLEIRDFHDLKITIIQVATVIMVILFLEQAVEVGASLETLYFGLAISAAIIAGVLACWGMKRKS